MIGEVIKKLIEALNATVDEEYLGQPFLSSHNYRTFPFNKDFFKPIRVVNSDRKLAFVDGGNNEIVGAPNFSIQLNRVYFNIFQGCRRISDTEVPQRIEFFSATSSIFRGDQIFFDSSIFPILEIFKDKLPKTADLSFKSTDRRLMTGNSRADIARVASIARRFAEWEYAKYVVENELDEGDILIMDGTLRTAFTNEPKYARAAFEAAKNSGVIYSGLSKTSKLFTTTGLSLLGAIRKMAMEMELGPLWYYYPIAESLSPEHEAAIFIIKLHEQSKRVFRYEIHGEQVEGLGQDEINEIFSQLSINSCDVSFPGYPYGLVDADSNARVRYKEIQTYKIMLLSEVSKLGSWSKFSRHIESEDAHEILNMMMG